MVDPNEDKGERVIMFGFKFHEVREVREAVGEERLPDYGVNIRDRERAEEARKEAEIINKNHDMLNDLVTKINEIIDGIQPYHLDEDDEDEIAVIRRRMARNADDPAEMAKCEERIKRVYLRWVKRTVHVSFGDIADEYLYYKKWYKGSDDEFADYVVRRFITNTK